VRPEPTRGKAANQTARAERATRRPAKRRTSASEVDELRARLREAEETLRAIRSGEVDAVVVTSPDGVERVFALEGADTPYRLLVEEMSEGALTAAEDGLILYANRRFAAMLDVPLQEVTGSSLYRWVLPGDRDALQKTLKDAVHGDSKHEFELIRGSTGLVPVYFCANMLPASHPPRLCVIVTDLTEERQHQRLVATQEALKASEARLLEASRLRDEFLATISHELRTPLNAILGWASLLKGGRLAPGKSHEAIEIIERNARAQVRLVDDLLDVSRVITGKLQLDVRPVSVVPLVETVLESLRPSFAAKDIAIETDWNIDGANAMADSVTGDPDRLQQIIWNLLSNAAKFTPPRGIVRVSVTRASTHLDLRVSDTGAGINPEFLPFVFDRFRQADSTTTRKYSGLGLGLAIVRHLVELHGGTVEARSAGEGQGATFIVRLPVRQLRDRSTRSSTATSSTLRGPGGADLSFVHLQGVHVLVVDDQPDAQSLVKAVLQDAGATAVGVDSVPDALDLLQRFTPDIIVADIGMPGQDGYSFMRELRERERARGTHVPAIALTAYGRAEDRAKALESGFDVHLRKPVERQDLISAIAVALGRVRVE
jgi:PAS domain S-box-containing protein